MIVIINGSFGVGKSSVARVLREALTGSTIYDPEWIGIALMRLPGFIKLKGSGTDDFQDINLWRKSAITGVKLFNLISDGPVIVPMTFSHRPYFDEVIEGLRRHHLRLKVFCLRASLPTVKQRLSMRGDKLEVQNWLARRIIECAEAHHDPHFGEPIDTDDRSPRQIADQIVRRL